MPNRFEAVFELIPHATAIIRLSDGAHLHVNDRLLQLSGFSREELIGPGARTIGMWTAEERERYIEPIVAARGGSAVVPVRKKDGTPIHLALTCSTIEVDGEPCLLAVGMDATEPQSGEAVGNDRDLRANVTLAALVHELRSPLTPILLNAELLKRRVDPQSRTFLDVIIRQAKHLERLVEDVLDISGVMRGKVALTKKRLELAEVVARAVEATGPMLETRGHWLALSVPSEGLAIDADEVRLTQVVSNLLSNAARYTPPGGHIAVNAAREGDEVVLRVRDSGIGIDPGLIPDIFKMFVQGRGAPVAESTYSGLGLGLSLVQLLTEMHGGTVTAHSDGPGHGSEFTVRLPASRDV